MLVIHDEQLAKQLQEIAEHEHRSVEEVLKSLVAQYPAPPTDESQTLKRIRRKAYARARQYWQTVGDSDKAAMTDAELDEQFWLFDVDGIPRLKSEQSTAELVPGTSSWLAAHLDELAFDTENPIDPEDTDDILDAEFANDLLKRMGNDSPSDSNG